MVQDPRTRGWISQHLAQHVLRPLILVGLERAPDWPPKLRLDLRSGTDRRPKEISIGSRCRSAPPGWPSWRALAEDAERAAYVRFFLSENCLKDRIHAQRQDHSTRDPRRGGTRTRRR